MHTNEPADTPLPAFAVERRAFLATTLGTALVGAHSRVGAAVTLPELRVVARDNSEATKQIFIAIEKRVGSFLTAIDPEALATRPGRGVYVALGPAAFEACLSAELPGPLIALFTSANAFRRLQQATARSPRRSPVSAIYAEASPAAQLRVARGLYGRRVTVGVLLSDSTAPDEGLLRDAAEEEELDLEVVRVEPGGNVLRALAQLRNAKAVLALPDPSLYTADSLRSVLESTYRREQGVIGFSAALVGAGVLAAPYSTLDDTIADFAELLAHIAGGAAPQATYPRYWRVAINDQVARSLNVVVDGATRSLGRRPG